MHNETSGRFVWRRERDGTLMKGTFVSTAANSSGRYKGTIISRDLRDANGPMSVDHFTKQPRLMVFMRGNGQTISPPDVSLVVS